MTEARTMTPDFRPSDVFLMRLLVGSFQKAEAEQAALIIIRSLVRTGDEWKPCNVERAIDALSQDAKEKAEPLWSLVQEQNPFFRPDPQLLVLLGYAQNVTSQGAPLEAGVLDHLVFTEQGFAGLAKHVHKKPRDD